MRWFFYNYNKSNTNYGNTNIKNINHFFTYLYSSYNPTTAPIIKKITNHKILANFIFKKYPIIPQNNKDPMTVEDIDNACWSL